MVYYFTTTYNDEIYTIYMGKDKFENESLIKYGLDTDLWFHVDNLSSAHVYLRIPADSDLEWDNLPAQILEECAQLTKANSIKGNKQDNLTIIYTPWQNLHKTGDMVDGQVGFHDPRKVKKVFVKERANVVINRLNKTKKEKYPDLQKERIDFEKKKLRKDQEAWRQKQKEELELQRQRKELAYQRDHAYDSVFTEDNVRHSSNEFRGEDWEEDFM